MKNILYFLITFLIITCIACSGGSDSIEDAIDDIDSPDDISDLLEDPDRKPINAGRTGINSFGNESAFGSVCQQFAEVKNTLRLKYIRILMQWNDAVQSAPGSAIAFGFYDELVNCLPDGTTALVVVAGLPSWMSDRNNWIDDNPRLTFVQNWLKPLVQRYGSNAKIEAWQIWNEPNMLENPDNTTLELSSSAENYVEMLASGYSLIKDSLPNVKVLNAATTSINQNYPESLRYNGRMRDAGAQQFVDVWAVHYYGKQFEKFQSGVKDFLNEIGRPVWITESGQQGQDQQLAYVETTWPYLTENVSSIDRIYYYQHLSTESAGKTFALKTNAGGEKISDLFVYLRDR